MTGNDGSYDIDRSDLDWDEQPGGRYWYCKLCGEHLNTKKYTTASVHALASHKEETVCLLKPRIIRERDDQEQGDTEQETPSIEDDPHKHPSYEIGEEADDSEILAKVYETLTDPSADSKLDAIAVIERCKDSEWCNEAETDTEW